MTLRGPASEFASRKLRATTQMTWAQLLAAMKERYADLSDAQFARQKMKRIKQNSGKSVQKSSERIIDLAEEAFISEDLAALLIQQQLKDVFIAGIQNDQLVRSLQH